VSLLREINDEVEPEKADKSKAPPSDTPADDEPAADPSAAPAVPEDGWNVGHLANHGILLSCDGFSIKLDLDQLNALYDLAEDGESGEVRDHAGKPVYVEVLDDGIVLSRNDDETYPHGILVDLKTLKELGIEPHESTDLDADEGEPEAEPTEDDEQPADAGEASAEGDTIDPNSDDEELEEGIKRAFRRSGKRIKPGFRVTSGFRKGRVVANIRNAYKPRAKARTRLKLRIAARKKKVIRVLKARRTRRKPLSKRLAWMNKRK